MAVGDLYRCALGYRNHSQLNVNVFYMKNVSAASAESANQIAQLVCETMAPIYQAIKPGGSGSNTYTCEVNKVARLESEIGSWTAAGPIGLLLGDTLPSVNAVTMSLNTGFAGPARRGRVFLGGVPVAWQANSLLNTGGFAGYNAWQNAVRDAFMGEDASTGLQLGVFSRTKYSLISNPFDDYWKPVTQMIVRSEIGTMKSRKVGVGA